MSEPLRVVCLLAREAGLKCLQGIILGDQFRIVAIATHRYLPASESPQRKERAEYISFKDIADQYNIPLITVDSKKEASLDALHSKAPWDILVSCSWRYHVSEDILKRASLASINLHRGKLPEYRGAEPIKKALMHGDSEVTVTAHGMVDEIDAGPILAEKSQRVIVRPGESLDESVARIKTEILPLYTDALQTALNKMGDKKLV